MSRRLAAALGLLLGAIDTLASDTPSWRALGALAALDGLLLTVISAPVVVFVGLLSRRSSPSSS